MNLRPGVRFGPYEILAALGAGGMGRVYRARDTRLGRDVAIKVLQLDASDVEIQARIEREARIVAQLSHPNICALYDISSEGGVPFLVMELLQGETLAARLARGALPLEQALTYGVQIAGAIDAAHRRGVVHRDLKPGNVVITRTGAKLLDFGLAKPVLPDARLQLSSNSTAPTTPIGAALHTTVGGTLPYMAPEQLEGKEADARADIFAFGAVLYEMVTGRRAFAGESTGRIVAAVMTQDPPRMSRFQATVPPALEELVRVCIAKDREDRWQNAHDLGRTLRWIAEGSAAVSREEAAALLRNVKATAPTRGRWGLAVVVLALLMVGGVASWRPRPASAGPRNVVVLPCRSLGDVVDRSFCDGIAETLTTRLVQLSTAHDLQVVPASHVRSERITTAQQAKQVLGATLAFEGSLLRAGDTLRLNYVILNPVTLQQIDAVSLTSPASDPFALQDQVVSWATRVLALRLTEKEQTALRTRGTQAAEAFAIYQRARGRLLSFQTPQDLDEAIGLFTAAIQYDRTYALAHASLGRALVQRYELSRDPQWIDRARESCGRALELDNWIGEGQLCAGELALRTGRYADAVTAFRAALDREPTSDEASLGLGRAYEQIGDRASAERVYRQTTERRPRYWAAHFRLGNHFRERAMYEEAVAAYERAGELNPGNAILAARLGGVYAYLGRYDEAIAAFQRSTTIAPTFSALGNWGMTLYRMRRYDAAVETLTRACELRDSHQCIGNLARAYLAFNRPGEANVLLRRAVLLAERELEVNPRNADVRLSLAEYHAKLGHRSDALDHVGQVQVGVDPHLMFYVALVHLQVGERATAIEWLQKAVAASLPRTELQAWAELDPLRQEPAFRVLLIPQKGA